MADEFKKVLGVVAAAKVMSDLDTMAKENQHIKALHKEQLAEAEELRKTLQEQSRQIHDHNEEMREFEEKRLRLLEDEANEAQAERQRKEFKELLDKCGPHDFGYFAATTIQHMNSNHMLLPFDEIMNRLKKSSAPFLRIKSSIEFEEFISQWHQRCGWNVFEVQHDIVKNLANFIIQDKCAEFESWLENRVEFWKEQRQNELQMRKKAAEDAFREKADELSERLQDLKTLAKQQRDESIDWKRRRLKNRNQNLRTLEDEVNQLKAKAGGSKRKRVPYMELIISLSSIYFISQYWWAFAGASAIATYFVIKNNLFNMNIDELEWKQEQIKDLESKLPFEKKDLEEACRNFKPSFEKYFIEHRLWTWDVERSSWLTKIVDPDLLKNKPLDEKIKTYQSLQNQLIEKLDTADPQDINMHSLIANMRYLGYSLERKREEENRRAS